jgi:uncharacterized membrane protein YeaQ/YmgE (transglycosylase-associated protein family)
MGAFSWILFGLIAGAIARWLTPGSGPRGCIVTIVIGIAGAGIGGWIGTMLGLGTIHSFDLRSMALAVVGAVVLLLALRALEGRSGGPPLQ